MTITIVLTTAAFAAAVFLLIHSIQTWRSNRRLLYLFTPILLAAALYVPKAIDQLLGYATNDLSDLRVEFSFINATGSDPVYILAVPQGAAAPRLYVVPKDMLSEEERKGITQAQAKTEKGVGQMGILREGDFAIYDFNVEDAAPKTQ